MINWEDTFGAGAEWRKHAQKRIEENTTNVRNLAKSIEVLEGAHLDRRIIELDDVMRNNFTRRLDELEERVKGFNKWADDMDKYADDLIDGESADYPDPPTEDPEGAVIKPSIKSLPQEPPMPAGLQEEISRLKEERDSQEEVVKLLRWQGKHHRDELAEITKERDEWKRWRGTAVKFGNKCVKEIEQLKGDLGHAKTERNIIAGEAGKLQEEISRLKTENKRLIGICDELGWAENNPETYVSELSQLKAELARYKLMRDGVDRFRSSLATGMTATMTECGVRRRLQDILAALDTDTEDTEEE